jgi:hypothetical protein
VLRRLLQHPGMSSSLRHPLLPNDPCPVLQYADDTLIFLHSSRAAILEAKHVLQNFELATGLSINYNKTTFLPVYLDTPTTQDLAALFGTIVCSFPQTYLGLPLSPHKLYVNDCLPLIASCDRYLSGWHASLLNRAGRLTLATAVLSSLPLHYMSALNIPKTTIKAIDRRRRAFFWTGDEVCHGSKCLVAWENACQ